MRPLRPFLASLVVAAWVPALLLGQDALPVSGIADPRLAPFDEMMTRFMREHKIPGAALAVSRDGKLVYARGFGHADREEGVPVRPGSLFRIASISKPITAAAILQLVDAGKLRLDDRPFEMLGLKAHLENGATADPRLRSVTVLQLLQHTGGFDRAKSFDPMFRPLVIARALEVKPPARPEAIIRYVMGRPLDFDPGTRYAYSNFGYCVLGRVIEHVSKEPYEQYVREHVLAPIHVKDVRVGHTVAEQRFPNEVKYYEGGRTAAAVVGTPGKQVPLPYGAWYLEAMDSHGAWIASAPDLVRFADAFNDAGHCPFLKPKTVALTFAPPPGPVGHQKDGQPRDRYYACGWSVDRVGDEGRVSHSGSLDGTSTILVRRHDGLNWAVLFNTRNGGGKNEPSALIDRLVHQAANAVKEWPDKDLHSR